MGYDANGNYTRTHNWSADASADVKILASRQDEEWDDLASAMELALLLDGRNAVTGNIPFGGNRPVNVGTPLSATNLIRVKDVIENVPIYMIDAETSVDRISVSASFYTTASAGTAPADSSRILVKMGSNKTSAVAIRLNTGDGNPHSAAVQLVNGSAVYSGAILSGGIYEFLWHSTDAAWQLMNPTTILATTDTPGVIEIATTAEAQAGTDTTRAITPATLADKFSADYATTASAGLIEIGTTAEVQDGSNVSVAVTPATLAAVAATTASAGLIEIATTAEVTAGTDASRAVTPAALEVVRNTLSADIYSAKIGVMIIHIMSSGDSADIVFANDVASAWSVSAVQSAGIEIIHNASLPSAHGMAINLQLESLANVFRQFIPQVFFTTADSFKFYFDHLDVATSTWPASCYVHIWTKT